MKRYGKFMPEPKMGISFEASGKTREELSTRNQNVNKANVYSKNYVNPVIPKGYEHIRREWNSIPREWNRGFIIERCSDGSQFVWIPVGSLASNGTLDGVSFTEKFGRRNYRDDEFSESEFHEPLTGELALQLESVKKYGGFYISCYNISKNKQTGKPQSVRGKEPWTNINFNDAKKVATMLETSDTITSHLVFGAEYDSVLEWFIESEAKNLREIAEDSTDWGNYLNTRNSRNRLLETASKEEWCVNTIYDFAGNVIEWTQEQNNSSNRVSRGGAHNINGNLYPVAIRDYDDPFDSNIYTGFRVALYIK